MPEPTREDYERIALAIDTASQWPLSTEHKRRSVTIPNGDVETILSALRKAAKQGWRWDMENAPRDGTWFQAWPGETEDGKEVVRCRWIGHADYPGWVTDAYDCADYEFNPTAWRELPPPPSAGQEKKDGY